MDSSLQEIIRSKNYALNNFSWNFTDVITNANKVIPESVVVLRELSEIRFYKRVRPITGARVGASHTRRL